MRLFDVRLAMITAMIVFSSPSLQAAIEHFGQSDRDKAISCEAGVLGKHIVWDFYLSRAQVMVPCPSSKTELLKALAEKGVTVAETGDWAYLVPSNLLPPWKPNVPEYMRLNWKKLIVEWEAKNFPEPGIPGSRPLSAAELQDVESQILREGRMIPVEEAGGTDDKFQVDSWCWVPHTPVLRVRV